MRIPDPIEQLESRIEREMNKVDAEGTYPCAQCGKRSPLETMGPVNGSPDSPLICGPCWDFEFGEEHEAQF